VQILRVHDVAAMRDVVQVASAITHHRKSLLREQHA
jgi:dihydropteroate synthase